MLEPSPSRRLLTVLLVSVLFAASCGGGGSSDFDPSNPLLQNSGLSTASVDGLLETQSVDPIDGRFEQDPKYSVRKAVVEMLNSARAREGRASLELDWEYTQVAQAHAEDMVARDFFAHTNPDGQDPRDRVVLIGDEPPSSYAGENIAAGFDDVVSLTEAWLDSHSHRETLMQPDITEVGVGIAKAKDSNEFSDGYYWVTDFRDD